MSNINRNVSTRKEVILKFLSRHTSKLLKELKLREELPAFLILVR